VTSHTLLLTYKDNNSATYNKNTCHTAVCIAQCLLLTVYRLLTAGNITVKDSTVIYCKFKHTQRSNSPWPQHTTINLHTCYIQQHTVSDCNQ